MVSFLTNPIKSFIIHLTTYCVVVRWILTQKCWGQEFVYLLLRPWLLPLEKQRKWTCLCQLQQLITIQWKERPHPPAMEFAYQLIQENSYHQPHTVRFLARKEPSIQPLDSLTFSNKAKQLFQCSFKKKKANSDNNDIYSLS